MSKKDLALQAAEEVLRWLNLTDRAAVEPVATIIRKHSASLVDSKAAAQKRVAVLHSIGMSGIGGSINSFWERLDNLSSDKRIAFCQALHQLCEIMGHNNERRCHLCETIGARNVEGYYTGGQFFDGTKTDYSCRPSD